MSHQGDFSDILDKLYEKRTGWLRTVLIRANPGPVPVLTKTKREGAIESLQEIASDALAKKMAKRAFQRSVAKKKTWMTKGWGKEKKLVNFRAWARRKIDEESGKVYVFWDRKECRYVGRTRGRGSRPSQHFKRGWFKGTTRIVVYMAPKHGDIPRLECLAAHRFRPSRNKIRAAKENRTPKCPLCALHKKIKAELRRIYRFR